MPTATVSALSRVREPSLETCAVECGARCCRGHVAYLTPEEGDRMRRLDPRVWVRDMAPQEVLRYAGNPRGHVLMDFRSGPCVFLQADKTCRIYADRPNACRVFPTAPHPNCLVWPIESA